jgi:hypothetical protein
LIPKINREANKGGIGDAITGTLAGLFVGRVWWPHDGF